MDYLLKGIMDHTGGEVVSKDIGLSPQGLVLDPALGPKGPYITIEGKDLHLFPGFMDVHVHLREPGFSYKETIASGTRAAARGGFGYVCAMPNVRPVPDSLENLKLQLSLIEKSAKIPVLPFGAITMGQEGAVLSDMADMAEHVAGFSDDGRGIQNEFVMRKAMNMAKKLDKIIAAHCEDESMLDGGYIHQGDYARKHGHAGISSESEWRQLDRDLALAEQTGCKYHVCHVSAKESVSLIRRAKARGVDVSCETAPHYLLLDDSQLIEGGRFKMNPPLRGREDREALLEGLMDGTIDMIATDHAPHTADDKAQEFGLALPGISGFETALAVLLSLVHAGKIKMADLLYKMSAGPAAMLSSTGLKLGTLENGAFADIAIIDPDHEWTVDSSVFLSKGKNSPFHGTRLKGKVKATIAGGKFVFNEIGKN